MGLKGGCGCAPKQLKCNRKGCNKTRSRLEGTFFQNFNDKVEIVAVVPSRRTSTPGIRRMESCLACTKETQTSPLVMFEVQTQTEEGLVEEEEGELARNVSTQRVQTQTEGGANESMRGGRVKRPPGKLTDYNCD